VNPRSFVAALSQIKLAGVFNTYADRCAVHDLADGPAVRRTNLRGYLSAIEDTAADTIWMGRDLGYRGGRRTGLALTDEVHLTVLAETYPGATPSKATKGPAIAERTAAEIWSVLSSLKRPPLLWNVFPFHPHEPDNEMTNRKFSKRELAVVTELNRELIRWLGIKRIVCIGQDAASYADNLGVAVQYVRHPSYGGIPEFRSGMRKLYGNDLRGPRKAAQNALF
jgi:hypothetical protein